jgi:DNA-binding transcriptional MocR family regulator
LRLPTSCITAGHTRLTAPDHPPQLVLGFGNLTEPAIERGIEAIADLISPRA